MSLKYEPSSQHAASRDRLATQGPSGGYLTVHFSEALSIFGDKCPQNGSKNGEMAPRTGTGYPHIGPFVGRRVDARTADALSQTVGVNVPNTPGHSWRDKWTTLSGPP